MREIGTVATLRRYPVKSMLGEQIGEARVTPSGVDHDRVFALVDDETGRVASAKRPSLWRALLQCGAAWDGTAVTITLPDGRVTTVHDGDVDERLSDVVGRRVHLSHARADGATIARPDPEDVIEHGVEADVPYREIELGRGADGRTFVDYAHVSLIGTSTLARIGTEAVRYRPNVLVATAPGVEAFAENDWAGKEIAIGAVRLRGLIPTPRCAIPTLAHGELPRNPDAVRALLAANRISLPDTGPAPCAGVYAEVVEPGTIHPGDTVALA